MKPCMTMRTLCGSDGLELALMKSKMKRGFNLKKLGQNNYAPVSLYKQEVENFYYGLQTNVYGHSSITLLNFRSLTYLIGNPMLMSIKNLPIVYLKISQQGHRLDT